MPCRSQRASSAGSSFASRASKISSSAELKADLHCSFEPLAKKPDSAFHIVQNDADTELMSVSPTGTIFLRETADAAADVAAYGQIWVDNNVAQTLYFTDDAGVDFPIGGDLAVSGGSLDTAYDFGGAGAGTQGWFGNGAPPPDGSDNGLMRAGFLPGGADNMMSAGPNTIIVPGIKGV